MNQVRRIVVMGGSFNPPTVAHLRLMQAAVDGVQADMGVFSPANHTYVKIKMRRAKKPDSVYSEQQRMDMLLAMCADDPRLTADDGEYHMEKCKNYEALVLLQEKYPEAEIYFILGADKLKVFPRWRNNQAFTERFRLLVFSRDGVDPEAAIMADERLRDRRDAFVILPEPEGVDGVSSTEVRRRLENGIPMDRLLHPGVEKIIRECERNEA